MQLTNLYDLPLKTSISHVTVYKNTYINTLISQNTAISINNPCNTLISQNATYKTYMTCTRVNYLTYPIKPV